jgi:hypothetical protein
VIEQKKKLHRKKMRKNRTERKAARSAAKEAEHKDRQSEGEESEGEDLLHGSKARSIFKHMQAVQHIGQSLHITKFSGTSGTAAGFLQLFRQVLVQKSRGYQLSEADQIQILLECLDGSALTQMRQWDSRHPKASWLDAELQLQRLFPPPGTNDEALSDLWTLKGRESLWGTSGAARLAAGADALDQLTQQNIPLVLGLHEVRYRFHLQLLRPGPHQDRQNFLDQQLELHPTWGTAALRATERAIAKKEPGWLVGNSVWEDRETIFQGRDELLRDFIARRPAAATAPAPARTPGALPMARIHQVAAISPAPGARVEGDGTPSLAPFYFGDPNRLSAGDARQQLEARNGQELERRRSQNICYRCTMDQLAQQASPPDFRQCPFHPNGQGGTTGEVANVIPGRQYARRVGRGGGAAPA